MNDVDPPSPPSPRPGNRLPLGIAAALVILQSRTHRRNLIFGLTLLTLVLVFGGFFILGDRLAMKPVAFLVYWALVFGAVMLVLLLAVYDLIAIRREHREDLRDLKSRLNREIALQEKERDKQSS
ncbi:MAG: hypothetical protein KDM91_08035 [Verrucomicrobiae bacterium]|nr:hypothetical protein [Verrucomicrobiae bacterium]MCP5540959.1 hypothetical protein [Akkermansiaceae bacterium]